MYSKQAVAGMTMVCSWKDHIHSKGWGEGEELSHLDRVERLQGRSVVGLLNRTSNWEFSPVAWPFPCCRKRKKRACYSIFHFIAPAWAGVPPSLPSLPPNRTFCLLFHGWHWDGQCSSRSGFDSGSARHYHAQAGTGHSKHGQTQAFQAGCSAWGDIGGQAVSMHHATRGTELAFCTHTHPNRHVCLLPKKPLFLLYEPASLLQLLDGLVLVWRQHFQTVL